MGEVKEWLREFGGVHFYDRGLRVHPYGDKGHDWLDMNLSRVRSPELRPSTNTSLGRLTAQDTAGLLVQKTDRSGFIENKAFTDLRQFAIDTLDWMARQRLQQREARRTSNKQEVPQASEKQPRRSRRRSRKSHQKLVSQLKRRWENIREPVTRRLGA